MHKQQQGKVIKVLIGQVSLTRAPNLLQAILGSCIGLSMYDPVNGLAGMAHILLPCSADRKSQHLPGKFADQAVPCLYHALLKHGAVATNLKAKLAGGARMFSASMSYQNKDIGSLNIEAVTQALNALKIRIVSENVGGDSGRKVEFDLTSYMLRVADLNSGETLI